MMGDVIPMLGPSSEDIEREVVAAALQWPKAVDMARDAGLKVEHFAAERHRSMWSLVVGLRDSVGDYDDAELLQAVREMPELERIGGMPAVSRMTEMAGTTAHVERYVGMIIEKAKLRALLHAARDIEAAVLDPLATSAECIALAESTLLRSMREDERVNLVLVGDALDDAFKPHAGDRYLRTGVAPLDGKTRGLLAGYLTIIPARPSMGKSSLARQIIAAGIRGEVPRRQVVFSCECDRGTMIRLLAAELCGATLGDVALATLGGGKVVDGLAAAQELLSHTPLFIDDSGSPTPGEIVRRCRSFADRHGAPDVVVIDHWHLLTHPRERGEREDTAQERGSRMLRAMAKELGAAVVVCAQLTKAGGRGRPTMEDIRECDALAQDAAQIFAPYRPLFRPDAAAERESSGEASEPEAAEIHVLKNRYGRTGPINVQWHGRVTRYV